MSVLAQLVARPVRWTDAERAGEDARAIFAQIVGADAEEVALVPAEHGRGIRRKTCRRPGAAKRWSWTPRSVRTTSRPLPASGPCGPCPPATASADALAKSPMEARG
jgi:hypothetical protein